jgi:tRNA pseudouridine38-40 synthase
MPTYKLIVEYDGTAYAGWQRQADQPTIQGAIEKALQQVTQRTISVIGAGRTDAGVHALGQVASFRSEDVLSIETLERGLNGVLAEDISVRSVEHAPHDFHARFSARQKLYEYRILNSPQRSALTRDRAWHVRARLDLGAMREAAGVLVGGHDFSSFQGSPTDTENAVCDVRRLEILQDGDMVRIETLADRFLKQMVRAIVGTLVEVGQGKRSAASIKDVLEARDRRVAGVTAPACGLFLMNVEY